MKLTRRGIAAALGMSPSVGIGIAQDAMNGPSNTAIDRGAQVGWSNKVSHTVGYNESEFISDALARLSFDDEYAQTMRNIKEKAIMAEVESLRSFSNTAKIRLIARRIAEFKVNTQRESYTNRLAQYAKRALGDVL